jgi:arginine deiminase
LGVEVVDAQDLLEEVLGDPAARRFTLDAMLPAGPARLRARLDDAAPEDLAAALVGGLRLPPGAAQILDITDLFEVPPLPNWCFQRDPQIVIGSGVVFSSMASAAREREAKLGRVLFHFHPDLAAAPRLHEPGAADFERAHVAGAGRACLEGGDVIVVSSEVIAVGMSERSNRLGIEDLAAALSSRDDGPRFLVVVELPRRRAYMHLDTVFTPVDREMALVFHPVLVHQGSGTGDRTRSICAEAPELVPQSDLPSC